ncbi:MAG TPA: hypothetical protein VFA47_05330 [Candidatus Manganitrophaceae bacterium]|nr:hypothetical protein [Candidatus Manganitrophaceae bacterium]
MERMQYFVHRVGAGEKASQDLTEEEAREAAELLLSGGATPAQAGGFLVALRMKGETREEMRAFTEAVRARNRPVGFDGPAPLDIPVYAGKKSFFHAIIPAGFLMAAAGQPVLLHGFSPVPGRVGAAEVLAALGIDTGAAPERGSRLLNAFGFAYLDVARFNPALHRFQALRNELGVRTIFNAVSRMADPAGAGQHLIGITHPPYFESTTEVLARLGSRRLLILRGVEGGPEPSITSQTTGFLSENGKSEPVIFPMEPLGLSWARRSEAVGGSPGEQALLTEKILSGKAEGPMRDWTLMTAAYGLFASGKAPALSDGWKRAEAALSGREGRERLREARKRSEAPL